VTNAERTVMWIWIAWKDKGSKLPLPPAVAQWYRSHKLKAAPLSWRIRYRIHQGVVIIPLPKPKPDTIWDYVAFTAWDPHNVAFRCSKKWTIALSADLAYRDRVTIDLVNGLQTAGYRVVVWGDCSKTPVSVINALAASFNVKKLGQMETVGEGKAVMADGQFEAVVGNASEIHNDPDVYHQVETKVNAGNMVFSQECYWGDGGQSPSNTGAISIAAR